MEADTATARQLPRFTRVTIAAVIVIILGSSEQARVEG